MTWDDREVAHHVDPSFNGVWFTRCGIGAVLYTQVRDGVLPTCLFCVARKQQARR
jgi:hypothetical protein